MQIKHNIKSYSVTWIANTYDKDKSQGTIENFYIPESLDEFMALCSEFYAKKESFRILGHSSNVYILPSTNIKNVISTKFVNKWHEDKDYVYCECGANVKLIVKKMVEEGMEGYACMVDLPGTVGAALYGNAGVSINSISGVMQSVDILLSSGEIRTLNYDDMKFTCRSSILKRQELEGVILSCKLNKQKGNKDKIQQQADFVHQWRLDNHPGSARNLGTTSLLSDKDSTVLGKIARAIAKVSCTICRPSNTIKFKTNVISSLLGYSKLKPYLFGLNRYMWNDVKAHDNFKEYQTLIRKLYKNPKLEIEVW